MTEQRDAPLGGAEGVEASAAVESNSEATTEQQTGAEDAGQADDAGEVAEKPKQVPWFQKRIDEVTAKRYEAEREAAYWRAKAEVATPQAAQPEPVAPALPTLEQFDYDEARYAAALAKHFEERTEKVLEEKLTKRQREQSESEKNNTAIAKLKTDGAKHSDFIAAVSGIPATEAVRDFVLGTDNAADVLYELGKDAAAMERFNSLSPVQQAIELGRRAAAPKATARTIAPPPPTTVSGLSAGLNKPADQMTMAEYAEARKAGKV